MKRITVLCLVLGLMGCAEKLQNIIDEPTTLLADPHYANYQQKMDQLEHDYLQKKISYATYVEEKKRLDDKYSSEVREREEVVGIKDQ